MTWTLRLDVFPCMQSNTGGPELHTYYETSTGKFIHQSHLVSTKVASTYRTFNGESSDVLSQAVYCLQVWRNRRGSQAPPAFHTSREPASREENHHSPEPLPASLGLNGKPADVPTIPEADGEEVTSPSKRGVLSERLPPNQSQVISQLCSLRPTISLCSSIMHPIFVDCGWMHSLSPPRVLQWQRTSERSSVAVLDALEIMKSEVLSRAISCD